MTAQPAPTCLSRFPDDQRGFTGAEKALLICFALAVIGVAGYLLQGGSRQASQDAARTLALGRGVLQAGAPGQILSPSALPRVGAVPAPAGQLREPQPLANGQDDSAYDGAWVGAGGRAYPSSTPMDQIPPVRPSQGEPRGTIIYTNGISTTKDQQAGSLQKIADTTGYQVIGVHNATGGFFSDIGQSAKDKFDIGKNPAVDSLSNAVYDSIRAGKPIHLVGHSQGALITSRALSDVRRRLLIEDGLSVAETERLMSQIKVETFGGAASSYPDGPQYQHYVNLLDPVPMATGLGAPGSYGGRGAKIHRFTATHGGGVGVQNPFTWPPRSPVTVDVPDVHGLEDIYLPRRRPF